MKYENVDREVKGIVIKFTTAIWLSQQLLRKLFIRFFLRRKVELFMD